MYMIKHRELWDVKADDAGNLVICIIRLYTPQLYSNFFNSSGLVTGA
jgi:hypothetical protein